MTLQIHLCNVLLEAFIFVIIMDFNVIIIMLVDITVYILLYLELDRYILWICVVCLLQMIVHNND